jgi:hypothetical protein
VWMAVWAVARRRHGRHWRATMFADRRRVATDVKIVPATCCGLLHRAERQRTEGDEASANPCCNARLLHRTRSRERSPETATRYLRVIRRGAAKSSLPMNSLESRLSSPKNNRKSGRSNCRVDRNDIKIPALRKAGSASRLPWKSRRVPDANAGTSNVELALRYGRQCTTIS